MTKSVLFIICLLSLASLAMQINNPNQASLGTQGIFNTGQGAVGSAGISSGTTSSITTDFTDNFETADFSKWSTHTDANNDITISTVQSHSPTHSARVNPTVANSGALLRKNTIGNVANSTFTVWAYLNSVTNPDLLWDTWDSVLDPCWTLHLTTTGGNLQAQLLARDDAGTAHNTATYTVAGVGSWHSIQVVIHTAGGTAGSGQLLIDSASKEIVTGFANATRGNLDRLQLSPFTQNSDIYFDDVSVTH